jgi:hypothetical protein
MPPYENTLRLKRLNVSCSSNNNIKKKFVITDPVCRIIYSAAVMEEEEARYSNVKR